MKYLKFLAALLLVGVGTPLIYFGLTPLKIAGVTVDQKPSCDDADDTLTYAASRWDGDTLVAGISEPQTCGMLLQSARVQRIGNSLFVRTSYSSLGGPVATCICRQNFDVRIPKMPRADYSISVYNLP